MLKKNEAIPLDIPTLIAISVVAWIVFNDFHTVLGHGGACLLRGDGIQAFTTTHAICTGANPSFWGEKLYFGFPHTLNFIAGLVFFSLLRFARITSPSLRYFLWLCMCFNIFNVGNALLVTAAFPGGDWSDFAAGLQPAILWQGGLTLLGVIVLVIGFRLAVQLWEPFIGGDDVERRRRINWLTWVACLTAFLTSSLPSLLSPLVFYWGILQAVLGAISVFWVILLPLWRWGPQAERQSVALPLARSVPWLVVAGVTLVLYTIQAMGVGTFPASLLR